MLTAGALMMDNHPVQLIPVNKLKHVLNGVFTVFTKANHFDELYSCYHDTVTDVNDISIAIEDFKKKDTTSILDGILHIGNFLVNLQKTAKDCTHMKDDLHRLITWVQEFNDPKAIMNKVWANILANYSSIISNLDNFNKYIVGETIFF